MVMRKILAALFVAALALSTVACTGPRGGCAGCGR
jgi:hypothetical protein